MWFIKNKIYQNVDQAIEEIYDSVNIATDVDIDDHDIDIFLEQQVLIYEYIQNLDVDDNQKKLLSTNWFKNAVEPDWGCHASTGKMAIGENGEMYPCLALALANNGNDYSTYKTHNLFIHYNQQRVSTSAIIDKTMSVMPFWLKECPAHNLNVTDTIYYQNCKFNVLIAEYNRLVQELFYE
jgi:hypothetical protein